MRKIEMRPIGCDEPVVIEFVEGHRYLAVVTTPEGATMDLRERTRKVLRDTLPPHIALLVLAHGFNFEVFDADVDPIQEKPIPIVKTPIRIDGGYINPRALNLMTMPESGHVK